MNKPSVVAQVPKNKLHITLDVYSDSEDEVAPFLHALAQLLALAQATGTRLRVASEEFERAPVTSTPTPSPTAN